MSGMINTEYTFTIAANIVKGVNKKQYDPFHHTIKFMGKLTPLYATPEQIKIRLSAWNYNLEPDMIDYELYKLIHEKSLWVDTQILAPTNSNELIETN